MNCFTTKSIVNAYLILGGPASGKTTWCKNYCENHTKKDDIYIHVPVGELLKREIDSGSEVGKFIFDCMNKSIIVPANITFDIMMNEIEKCKLEKSSHAGCITLLLDGYPRNKENKEYFYNHKPDNLIVSKVIYIECDKQTMIERIEKRKEQCDRFDDKLINGRMGAFELYTIPLLGDFDSNLIEITKSQKNC